MAEDQLATDHKALNRTEGQYRDQIGERNTLLLTVYQYMDKVAAPTTDRTPVCSLSLCSWLETDNDLLEESWSRTKTFQQLFGFPRFAHFKMQEYQSNPINFPKACQGIRIKVGRSIWVSHFFLSTRSELMILYF